MAPSAEPNDASCKSSDCDSQLDERVFSFFFLGMSPLFLCLSQCVLIAQGSCHTPSYASCVGFYLCSLPGKPQALVQGILTQWGTAAPSVCANRNRNAEMGQNQQQLAFSASPALFAAAPEGISPHQELSLEFQPDLPHFSQQSCAVNVAQTAASLFTAITGCTISSLGGKILPPLKEQPQEKMGFNAQSALGLFSLGLSHLVHPF